MKRIQRYKILARMVSRLSYANETTNDSGTVLVYQVASPKAA